MILDASAGRHRPCMNPRGAGVAFGRPGARYTRASEGHTVLRAGCGPVPRSAVSRSDPDRAYRRRSALAIIDTEEGLIGAAAKTGLCRTSRTGYISAVAGRARVASAGSSFFGDSRLWAGFTASCAGDVHGSAACAHGDVHLKSGGGRSCASSWRLSLSKCAWVDVASGVGWLWTWRSGRSAGLAGCLR